MKGKARRLLSWVCVLALCMSLLPVTALAAPGSAMTGTETDKVSAEANGVTVNKWVSTDEDGNYRLNMEAYASNVVTTESKTTPLDIVLVLDQSGSMDDDYSWWTSKLDMLKSAATNFVRTVFNNAQENDVNHRIAVVGFASDRDLYGEYENTGLFVDGKFQNYGDLNEKGYGKAFQDVVSNSRWGDKINEKITSAINALEADGDTYSEYGMTMANNIFANNPVSNNERHRVVVMFTDGYTAPSGTDDFKYSMANAAIEQAYTTKNTYRADVYTIGLFDGANPRADITIGFKNNDGWNDWENKNSLTANQETIAANRYMHYVSSNYQDVTRLQDGGIQAEGSSYYMAVNSSTSLEQIFSDIAENITKNTLKVYPDKDAELTDTLSQYFNFPKGLTGNSEEITVKYVPVDKETGEFKEASADDVENVDITVKDDTITVTGFNYVENAVTLENDEYSGGKLVVSFPIELDAAECGYQGGTYPTNDTTKNQAGLHYKDKQDASQNNASTLLDKSPTVTVDASQVERQGTAIDIKVYVDSQPMSNDEDVGTYVAVTPKDSGSFDEQTDKVNYTFTYYDCKDISFAAEEGYVIEAVDADLVYGQSVCQGITNTNGTVTADNVQGGSTVTVYVRTLYTIQYHNGESIENTVNLVAETSSLTPNSPMVEKPEVGDTYNDEQYIQVGQEDTHAPATPSGKQAPFDFTYVNNGLTTSEEIKALPTDASGQLMYSGWYVGNSGNTEYLLAPGTDFQNEQYNFETYDKYDADDNVINLYCTSAAARHQINIFFKDDSQEPTDLKEKHTEEQSHNYQYNFAPSREENAVVPMTISYDSQTYVFDHFNGDNSGTLTENVEFTAVYSVDSNNNGVPDKYEATVTYKVVNGTWSDGTSADQTATFAMRFFDNDSNIWVETNPTLDDQGNTIPTGMKPATGYDANSGSWDVEPTGDTSVVNGITYTYTYKDQLNYTVTIEYKDEEGNTLANNETISNQIHGSTVDLTARVKNTIINGDNTYVRVNTTSEPSVTITENTFTITANTTITYVYALDNWNDEDDTETGGDNIPDKYQALVKFAAKENGEVSGTGITQVFTLTDDNDNYVESGTITPVENGITITPNEGYAFDIWTEGDNAVNPFTAREVKGGDTITFYANFDTDKIGTKDPDKGDGTPDKYQATVTYQVVGGTWSENDTDTVEKVYTLYEKNEDGQWTKIDPVPTIPESDIPDVGEITPEDQYMLPGTWDNDPEGQSVDADSDKNIYTYTLTQQAPSVNVEKNADKTSVKVGETINYTVTVTNNGNVDLANVAVQDEMMNSTTVTVTAKDSDGADVTPDGTWSENTYTIANLPVGVTYTFEYSYTATENDVKSGVSNTVTVDAPNLPEDPSDTVKVQVLDPKIDIEKALTAVNGGEVPTDYNAQVGDALTYTITVTNTGNTSFEEITVTDTMWASDKVTAAILGENQDIDVSGGQYQHLNDLMPGTSIKITYIYTVQSSDIGTNEISNTASVSTGTDPDDPTDKDTVNVHMDDYTVTITPADITIYTGGDGYGGVTDEDGNIVEGTENSGLPEPGYHIDLPAAVESWLQEHGADLDDAANLAEQLAFRYFDEDGNIIRNWDLENQGVYSKNTDGTVSRYVYSLSPNTVEGENKGVQVRLAFTDDGNIVTTDNIWMNENTVSASYDMTIYGGGLQQSEIKAVFTAGDESITCTVKIGTGHLLVKSVTNEGTTTNGIEASSDTVDADTITAVADENVTYYVNNSEVEVKNEGDRVQLLVDEVSNGEEFNAAMGADAIERVTNAAGNTLSNAAYDLAYMDLVDTQNGNTVVTMGEDQSLTIYWPVPEDAAEDSAFHVVHYYELDREEVTNADDLGEATTQKVDTKEVNGQSYVVFETSSFSPFALVYEKAPDPVASLDVTKTLTAVNDKAPGSSVSVGDTLTYTITVKNGEVALKDVTITDTFTGKGDLNFRLPDGATVSENQDGTYTITLGDLTAGQEVTITATYKVLRADASSDLVNTAKVTGTNPDEPDTPVTDEVQTPETPVNPYHPPIRPPEDPDKPELNTEDHYAYIVGYEDGSVQPEGDITRAEVATIFFRLLTDESRNEYWSQTNPYSDVSADDWFNNAVSTLTNAGVLDGYEDGTFKPNGNITRAEFATITARFFEATYDGENLFPDIEGHWAQDYINEAANAGIVNGYEDGTFRPQQYITRAEAVTMVNRTIDRHPDADHLLEDMIVWPDNPETAWYYEQVQEATNSHEYTMNTDDEQNPYEIWTKLLPNRDWSELEKEWSDANDGAGSGEVV